MRSTYTFSLIRNQGCPNESCTYYNQQHRGNVVIHSQKFKRVKCTTCDRTWVTYRNELYYKLKTSPDKISRATELLVQRMSIRGIARNLHISPSTVQRWKRRLQQLLKEPQLCNKSQEAAAYNVVRHEDGSKIGAVPSTAV